MDRKGLINKEISRVQPGLDGVSCPLASSGNNPGLEVKLTRAAEPQQKHLI
jgi:hypothetical protein